MHRMTRIEPSLIRRLLINPAALALLFSLLLIAFVNRYALQPLPEEPLKMAEYWMRAGRPGQAGAIYRELLASRADDLDLQHKLLQSVFRYPAGDLAQMLDLAGTYSRLAARAETAGVGHYGLGWLAARQGDYRRALDEFRSVPNRDQKYLNYAIGWVYLKQGHRQRAGEYFRREISLSGAVEEAVRELAPLYLADGDYQGFKGLAAGEQTAGYLRMGELQRFALANGEWGSYLRVIFLVPYRNISLLGGLNALIICLVWAIFLLRVAVFRRKSLVVYLALLAMGMASANVSLFLGDLLDLLPFLSGNAGLWQGLVRSLLRVGLVEETVKFIPVLVVVLLSRRVDEPFDLIAYGSFSALGFATLENALYFSVHGLGIVAARFLYSVVVHVAMTSLICYAWAAARYLRPRNRLWPLLGSLALASILHGLFDFFLGSGLPATVILSYAISLVLAREYQRMICNALNHSPFFMQPINRSGRLVNFDLFLAAACLLLLVSYLSANFDLSTEIANHSLRSMGLTTLPAMIALSGSLGKIGLARGQSLPLLRIGHSPLGDNSS